VLDIFFLADINMFTDGIGTTEPRLDADLKGARFRLGRNLILSVSLPYGEDTDDPERDRYAGKLLADGFVVHWKPLYLLILADHAAFIL